MSQRHPRHFPWHHNHRMLVLYTYLITEEEELYKEALAFNSFWFPQQYIQTALFFKINKNTDWKEVNPEVILGYDYSAISNWSKNVKSEIAKIPDLLPKTSGGAGCGV